MRLIVPHNQAEIQARLLIARPSNVRRYNKNIFVGNPDFDATEQSVRTLFEAHGAVQRVAVVTDRDRGRSRGFVEMTDSSEGGNGPNAGGRALKVSEARPKSSGPRAGRSHSW